MANRLFNQFSFGLEKMRVSLFMRMTIGASGAPTLDASNSKGIASVSRLSAGNYRITLQDSYVKLLMAHQISIGTSTAASMIVMADSVSSSPAVVDVRFLNSAGAAVELGNGEVQLISLVLRNSTAP